MLGKALPILKLGALLLMLVFTCIAILYICDFFTGAEIKRLAMKSMAMIGVITAFFTVTVLLFKEK
jgi:hypothetical protein